MNSLLLNSIRIEYENSPLSLEEICSKHKINQLQLGDTSAWHKKYTQPLTIEVLSPPTIPQSQLELSGTNSQEDEQNVAKEFKTSLLVTAKSLIKNIDYTLVNGDDLTAKDIKDLSATLVSLKETILGKDPTVQVNLQQNNNTVVQVVRDIIKDFSDDC
jgi:hypothetical protein